MKSPDSNDKDMIFAQEEAKPAIKAERAEWKILIVDDDKFVHEVTRMALANFEFDGRGLKFINAFSAAEGEKK